MTFDKLPGQQNIKSHLEKTIKSGRIAHAQIFSGHQGSGLLVAAIAYANELLKLNNKNPDQSELKVAKLVHPDLHFVFPVAINDKVKKHPVSDKFLGEWRTFVEEQPFGGYYDWLKFIGIDKKQAQIGVDEAEELVKKMQLKPFEGGFKVVIIWQAEKLNTSASNKLLKLIEEPPKNTIFLLTTTDYEKIINTIQSRCQQLEFPRVDSASIAKYLKEQFPNFAESNFSAITSEANGNLNLAVKSIRENNHHMQFEQWFITWIRTAFKAKGNPSVVENLITWSEEIASQGRENQKQFLNYCLEFFRNALLLNYGVNSIAHMKTSTPGFDMDKFAPFVHESNIQQIVTEIENANYHIERNGNAKLILLDTSIKLTRYLHQKSS